MDVIEYLETYCEEVTPREFYRDMFPEGELEAAGQYERGKYCGIAVSVSEKDRKVKRYSVTDDLNVIDELCKCDDFCIMSPISYAGKERKSANARFLYALAIDLDGIRTRDLDGEPEGMVTLFYQFDGNGPSDYLPMPTYIVFSGSGLHLYYFFEKPIPLFRNVAELLERYKRRLTWQLWTQGVTDREHQEKIQYESLFQGFRMPGTITKRGNRARAFLVGGGRKVSLEYLNRFVPAEYQTGSIVYKSNLTRAAAKEKYPEWYEKRIVQKQKRGSWTCKRDLYDWWKRKIEAGGEDGHRFWCIMTLATYAVKCRISREELEKDAMGFIDLLDSRGKRPDNPFTADDVLKALEAYNEDYVTYPIDTITARTGIPIEKNKRNGRRQKDHVRRITVLRDLDHPDGQWRNKDGRPKKAEVVKAWRQAHPDGNKAACIRETGLSKPTVYKWWEPEKKKRKVNLDVEPVFREMTPEEAAEYDRLTAGARQMEMEDFMLSEPVTEYQTEEESFPVDFGDGDVVYMTKSEIEEYNRSKWHKELPEFYVVKGDPNLLQKVAEMLKRGARSVEFLSPEEEKYLLEKKKK